MSRYYERMNGQDAQLDPDRTGGECVPRLVLASRSPRRRQLLDDAGILHEAEHPGVDDGELEAGGGSPGRWVAALAYFKAAAGLASLQARGAAADRLVVGADTVCVKDGWIMSAPADDAEAAEMLAALAGGEHEVLTGVALIETDEHGRPTGEREMLVDRARVRLGAIGADDLAAYIAGGAWRGKAGAYNLTERLEAGWPIEYDGDPATIMGLPMRRLLPRLRRAGRAGGVAEAGGCPCCAGVGAP